MKKFFNLILAALVIIGAVACSKNDQIVDQTQQGEGLSFYAKVVNDVTRAYIDNADGDKTWNTVWEGDEVLVVESANPPYVSYKFTCADKETGKFVCADAKVQELIGEPVTIMNEDFDSPHSRSGKSAFLVWTNIQSFSVDQPINLVSQTSFFRYTYNGAGKVTLSLSLDAFREPRVDVSGYDQVNQITFEGKGETFVPFWPGTGSAEISTTDATLSYSINGVKCKQTTIKNICWGKVYNLGTLADPVATAYSVPGSHNGWTAGATPMYKSGDLCVAYGVTFAGTGTFKILGNDKWYGAEVKVGEWVSASTESNDMTVDSGTYDIYFSEARTMVCVVAAGSAVPEIPAITWALSGTFNSWGDLLMQSTDTANLSVAKGVELAAGGEIKVKDSASWDTSFGRGVTYLAANSYMKVIQGSQDNITIAQSGTYDVYFEYLGANSRLYLMKANADYKTAKEQTADGSLVPDQPQGETPDQASVWSLSGTLNNWGDTPMVTTTVKNLFVAKSVKVGAYASFKVRKNKAWTENYGGGIVYMNPNGYIEVFSGGSDISNTAAGTFDFYFDYANKRLYMVTAGSDYTKVSKQSVEGKEPVQEEPEVTDKKLYLKPNSNWKQSNARFAAYFFGNGDKWVSMTDADKDGIYELNIPAGYDYGCNVIFCRMNPSTSANNWNNKWNQTSDLKAPTDGKNLYTVKDGTWDKGGGTWSVK
jgi:hypothetical protein